MNLKDINDILNEECSVATLYKTTQATNTQCAYRKGWRSYTNWCQESGRDPLAATSHDIVRFLIEKAVDLKNSSSGVLSLNTVRLYRSAINDMFRRLGIPSPTQDYIVRELLRSLAKYLGGLPRRVKALSEHHIVEMIHSCDESLHGIRDAAVIALGFAAALRRSELCYLLTTDIEYVDNQGALILIRHSKTDSLNVGHKIAVPTGRFVRPVKHLSRWLVEAGIRSGYVFQTLKKGGVPSSRPLDPGNIAKTIKRYCGRIGLDPSEFCDKCYDSPC